MDTELAKFEKIPAPDIPKHWDFDTADKAFDRCVYSWRRLTLDVVSRLWVFYKKLKVQGRRTDLSENSDKLPTWLEWIKNKGIDHDTVLNHFRALGWLPAKSMVGRLTGNAENYTKKEYVDKIRRVLGEIDLDPASCEYAQETIQAKNIYTKETDGLTKKWFGRVFLNPPYGMPDIRKFTDKLIEELPNIDSAILLTNDQTDTDWWHKCATNADIICLPDGRLSFYTPDKDETSPTNGQTFFYFGRDEKRFMDEFKDLGLLVKVI